jgi:hypothetical protein
MRKLSAPPPKLLLGTCAVFLRVMLVGFLRVFACMRGVLVRDLRVMCGLLMITGLVMLRRFVVMLRRVLMMVCCLTVMLSSFMGHRLISLDRNSVPE